MEIIESNLSYEEAQIQLLDDAISMLGGSAYIVRKLPGLTKKILRGEAQAFSELSYEDIYNLQGLLRTHKEKLRKEQDERLKDGEEYSSRAEFAFPWQIVNYVNNVADILKERPLKEELEDMLKDKLAWQQENSILHYLELVSERALTTAEDVAAVSGLELKQAGTLLEGALAERLENSLETALENGAKYQELVEKAKASGLENSIQEQMIETAITDVMLSTFASVGARPKVIADELQAPYSLILRLYKSHREEYL